MTPHRVNCPGNGFSHGIGSDSGSRYTRWPVAPRGSGQRFISLGDRFSAAAAILQCAATEGERGSGLLNRLPFAMVVAQLAYGGTWSPELVYRFDRFRAK
jgi:hypothetical protein